MSRDHAWAATLLLGSAMFAAAADHDESFPIPLHQASYAVALGGLHIGDAHFTLSRDDDGSYRYQSVTHTAGLVALLKHDIVTETTHFLVEGSRLQPLEYSYTQKGGSDDQTETIRFDWAKGSADTEENGHASSARLAPGTYDRFLSQLLLSFDAAKGRQTPAYVVLDHSESSSYSVQTKGEAAIRTPAGNFQSVELELSDGRKGRVTDFWLVPELHYLPAQIEQRQPDKATISLVLTDITVDSTSKP
jgi:hypothetical protein